jgi:hypothetical protein
VDGQAIVLPFKSWQVAAFHVNAMLYPAGLLVAATVSKGKEACCCPRAGSESQGRIAKSRKNR